MVQAMRLTAGVLLLGCSAAAVAALPARALPVHLDYRPIFAVYGIYQGGSAVDLSGRDIDVSPDRTLATHIETGSLPGVRAYLELASRYESGRGVRADPVRAFAYYQAAALRGDGFAQIQVAGAYEAGRGVEREPTQAVRWYRLAAEQGFIEAQIALIRLLAAGEDVPAQPLKAYRWTLVVSSNPVVPQEMLRTVKIWQRVLERQLDPEQVEAAHRAMRARGHAGDKH